MRRSNRARMLTATVGGLVIGTLAARIARPGVRRLAARFGISVNAASAAVETAVPAIAFATARKIASRAGTGSPARRRIRRTRPEAATRRSRTLHTAGSAGRARTAKATRTVRMAQTARARAAGAGTEAGAGRDRRTARAPRTPAARRVRATGAQSKRRSTVETSGPATIRTGDRPQDPTGPTIDLH